MQGTAGGTGPVSERADEQHVNANPAKLTAALFVSALVLRAGWIGYRWLNLGAATAYPDEELHWELATNLVHDGVLISNDGRLAARMPLYPLFLATFAAAGEYGVLAARLAQALLSALTVVIGQRLALAVWGPRGGFIAGLCLCCDPFAIFFCNLLLTETLFTFLAVLVIACAWLLAMNPCHALANWGLAAAGAAAVLTRPTAAGWLPGVWGLLAILGPERRRLLLRLVVCPLVVLAALLPWGVRNKIALDSFAWFSTNGGVTLYDAQGPQATGASDQSFLLELGELRRLGEVQCDRELRRLAWGQMRADPTRVLRLAWIKFLRTWSLRPNVTEYSRGSTAWVAAGYTVLVLAGAATGLASVLRRGGGAPATGGRRLHAIVWLAVAYFTLVHCVFIGSVRYRVPLMPLLCLAAGGAALTNRQRSNVCTKC